MRARRRMSRATLRASSWGLLARGLGVWQWRNSTAAEKDLRLCNAHGHYIAAPSAVRTILTSPTVAPRRPRLFFPTVSSHPVLSSHERAEPQHFRCVSHTPSLRRLCLSIVLLTIPLSLPRTDPFADEGDPLGSTQDVGSQSNYIHIRIQQRNGRKTLTTLQGLPKGSSPHPSDMVHGAC